MEGEQIFLQVQIKVRLQITETHRVLKVECFKLVGRRFAFYLNEKVKVINYVEHLVVENVVHVGFNFWLKVV